MNLERKFVQVIFKIGHMNMLKRTYLTVLFITLVYCSIFAQGDPLTTGSLLSSLRELKTSFFGTIQSLNPAEGIPAEINWHNGEVEKILNYMLTSEEGFEVGSEYLINAFGRYIEIFSPSKNIDKEAFKKYHPKRFVRETSLYAGLDIYAYLLVELAIEKQSPAFARRVLITLWDAHRSRNYETWLGIYYRYVEDEKVREFVNESDIDEVKRKIEKLKADPMAFYGGGDYYTHSIGWALEQFMTKLYLSDKKFLLPPATEVIENFGNWKKEKFGKAEFSCFKDEQGFWGHKIMQSVAELIKALPEQ